MSYKIAYNPDTKHIKLEILKLKDHNDYFKAETKIYELQDRLQTS